MHLDARQWRQVGHGERHGAVVPHAEHAAQRAVPPRFDAGLWRRLRQRDDGPHALDRHVPAIAHKLPLKLTGVLPALGGVGGAPAIGERCRAVVEVGERLDAHHGAHIRKRAGGHSVVAGRPVLRSNRRPRRGRDVLQRRHRRRLTGGRFPAGRQAPQGSVRPINAQDGDRVALPRDVAVDARVPSVEGVVEAFRHAQRPVGTHGGVDVHRIDGVALADRRDDPEKGHGEAHGERREHHERPRAASTSGSAAAHVASRQSRAAPAPFPRVIPRRHGTAASRPISRDRRSGCTELVQLQPGPERGMGRDDQVSVIAAHVVPTAPGRRRCVARASWVPTRWGRTVLQSVPGGRGGSRLAVVLLECIVPREDELRVA